MGPPRVHGLGDGLEQFRFVAWPEDTSLQRALGGKASALVTMSRAGLPVPPWCVLLLTSFTASTSVENRMKLAQSADPQATRALLAKVCPSTGVRIELGAAVSRLCPGDEDVAVRSPAAGEDSAQSSFAGQLKSFLSVAPGQVAERVTDVWRSGFTARVLAYRKSRGCQGAAPVPAVIVQRMVQPRVCGVAFSADPVSGRRDVAVVSAVRGVGETLVSGAADADTWRVRRDGEILSQSLIAERAGALEGESPQPVANGALSLSEVQRVVQLALETERLFGAPQDVEWTMEGERVYLLQSRPITTLSGEPGARSRLRARELLRDDRARVFARVRQVMIEIGNRLVDGNRLEQRDDVFYLRIEKLLDFADGCTVTTDLKALVTLRRREFSAYDTLPAPPVRFETWGPIYLGNRKSEIGDSLESCGTCRSGLGSCPGRVRGPARIVSDPANARVLPGDIVVARHTDPGWVLVLPMAAGLLVERGNLLSHAAIIARELGLPTVVSIPGLMEWLHGGDQVELDGTVTKLESGENGSSAQSPEGSNPGATS